MNLGAEETSDDSDEDESARSKGRISSSMQRSIDRLLNATFEDSKNLADGDKGRIIDDNGKIKFDRRIYDLEMFKVILSKVDGFDYRNIKVDQKSVEEMDISLSSART